MITKYLLIFLTISILSACSASYKELSNGNYVSDKIYNQKIIEEYRIKADFEALEMHDWNSAKLYSEKALSSYYGELIKPENINKWKINKEDFAEIEIYYIELLELYELSLKVDPSNLAISVVSFDCWAEQLEEGWQTNHINRCKSNFINSFNKIKASIKKYDNEKSEKYFESKSDKLNEIKIEKIVYFDFDSDKLNSQEIFQLKSFINNNLLKKYHIIGHTDSKGTKKYNYNLSMKRALHVKEILLDIGILTDNISIVGKGENNLAIPTPDNAPHPVNRRAVIKLNY